MNTKDRWQTLIASYQMERISDEEFAELEAALRASPEARALFHRATRLEGQLRREADALPEGLESRGTTGAGADTISSGHSFQRKPFLGGLAAAAAVVVLSAITWTIAAQKRIVATLVSSENAGWESTLPTTPGSHLTKGTLRLATGIATIQFDSGVSVTLEAPARLNLKGPKRARLTNGTAIVTTAGSDEFLLETVHGQAAIENGELVVVADSGKSRAEFEVLSGSVVVSHDASRKAVQLAEGGSAALVQTSLESSEVSIDERPLAQFDRGLRLRSDGRAATFIRNDKPHKWTRPEFLTLKKSNLGHGFEQRVALAFDLSNIEASRIEASRLRVNLVPSGIGLASRLPKVNRFGVYGLTNPAKANWSTSDPWELAPGPEDGVLVAQFEIPRSQQTGAIEIAGEAFQQFVADRAGRSLTLLIVRETGNREGPGSGLVHALASDSHPEAAGPVLELILKP